MMNPLPPRLDRLLAWHANRDPDRVARKYARMRRDAFAFLRGDNVLFQEDWASGAGVLRKGPLAWQSGDLHAENVGSFRGGNRLTYFDITDFDDAVLAPVALDLTRLCTSILVAAAVLNEGSTTTRASLMDGPLLASQVIAGYRKALTTGKAWWIERAIADGLVGELLRGLRQRRRRDFLAARVRLSRRTIRTDGIHALPAPAAEQVEVAAAVREALINQAPDLVVHDVARRIAGNGSLGLPRWALLVEHAVPDTRFVLLDAKMPAPSPAMIHAPVQPAWPNEATRVVTIQALMQAAPPALHHVVPFGDTALVLRELQPREDRVQLAVAAARPRALRRLLVQMGQLLAWGQLRASGWLGANSGDGLQAFGRRDDWEHDLLAYAIEASATTLNDWRVFAEAYDAGRLTLPEQKAS